MATPELHPAPVVSPWHHLAIDFIEPLTPSTHGCRYILTVNNYFTKFVQACAMAWQQELPMHFSRYASEQRMGHLHIALAL